MSKPYNASLAAKLRPEYDKFMERAEQIRWSPSHVAYDKVQWDKLSIGDLFAVFVTLHIENYSDVYTKLLLEHYADAPLLSEFIRNWEREEENHARVLERYLIELGMPLEELKANYAKVDKNDFPFPSQDQAGLNVFVFFQELLTREMYAKMLKSCREPVLTDILKRIVRDEERHYRFYKLTLGMRMELDKRDTLAQFRAIIRTFGMPQTMFRQKAMTDKLMEYYQYEPSEITSIVAPVAKFLEATPSRLLKKFPRAQRAWQHRRAAVFLAQSPHLWGHVAISLRNRLGLGSVNENEKNYVQSVIDRLHGLLESKKSLLQSGKVAVHDRLAAFAPGVGDSLVTKRAHTL